MYCRNCGKQVDDASAFCTQCGAAKGAGSNFCPSCGIPVSPQAVICVKCGCGFGFYASASYAGQKSRLVAGLLGVLLGAWGIHNFYLGNTSRGVGQIVLTICTCGIAGLWGFIEGILILCHQINTDSRNIPLKED